MTHNHIFKGEREDPILLDLTVSAKCMDKPQGGSKLLHVAFYFIFKGNVL